MSLVHHPIFTHDPADWVKLVHSQVTVLTENGDSHGGYVYTIDPVSESLVLIHPSEGESIPTSKFSLKILMRQSIKDISVVREEDEHVKLWFASLFRDSPNEELSESELMLRRDKLKDWLEKNRIPVAITGHDGKSLSVFEALVIRPPYNEHSCLSTNEIILLRTQNLIKNMP